MAVVLDDQMKVDAKTGEVSHQPWSADELARFTRLVQDSVGYDASRGDSVSVINAPFAPAQAEEIDSIPFYSQPWFWDISRGARRAVHPGPVRVLRPVPSNITGGGQGQVAGRRRRVATATWRWARVAWKAQLADDRVSIGGPSSILLPSPTEGYDAQLNAIKNLVAQDPGRVAQVVKEWINADE